MVAWIEKSIGEGGFDGGNDGGVIGDDFGGEAGDDVAAAVNEEFFEVPQDARLGVGGGAFVVGGEVAGEVIAEAGARVADRLGPGSGLHLFWLNDLRRRGRRRCRT